ncbi:MAG: M20/M25/M40 family metallo-hydrolase [bacterium]|nr:M20/M25/M40 family metallo-hydrolase [bacterium]
MKYILLIISFLFFFENTICQTIDAKYIREIESLISNESVKKAFEFIKNTDAETSRDHILLTEIPAPRLKEEKRAEKFAEMLDKAGADRIWIDNVGNVIAYRKGTSSGRIVAIGAHMDTVFPEGTDVTVKFRGDTLYAPGIGDDTRGMAIVLAVLRALEAQKIETESDILFIGTVGEEGLGDLRGVKNLFGENGPGIDSWISVDGAGLARIVNGALGSIRYRITYRGPGGHSWGAFGLANPQHALGRAIKYFVDEADEFTREGPRTSYNVGRIGGGTSINSIPYDAWMEIDMRSVSPEKLKGIDNILQKAARKALNEQNDLRRGGKELTMDVDKAGERPSGIIDPDVPLIQRAMAAVRYFGEDPSLATSSTDSNIPISLGIPAITIGRGGIGAQNHSLNEWWINKDGYKAIQMALTILLAEAGISK